MSDWKNNQYDHGPKPDPLAGEGDLKYGIGVPLLFLLLVVCLVGLAVWLFGALLKLGSYIS